MVQSLGFLARARAAMVAGVVLPSLVGCQPSAPDAVEGVSVRRGGDLLAAGGSFVVRDSVPGDVMATGGEVDFLGGAGGDVLVAGGDLDLSGEAAGNVRAAGGDVRVATDVTRNATIAGGNVVIERPARIGGNAYLAGGAVRLEGRVDQLLRAAGGDVVLNGSVGGDVHVESSSLRVGPDAVITGDLRHRTTSADDVDVHADAQIGGEVIALEPTSGGAFFGLLRWLWLAGFLVAGAVVVAVLPVATRAASDRLGQRPGMSFALGLGWLLVVPLVVVAVGLTLVGLPLALVLAALYLISVYLARAVVAVWLGAVILRWSGPHERGRLVLAFLLGGVVLLVLGLLPWVGGLIRAVATVFGLGGVALLLWHGRSGAVGPPRPAGTS